MKVCVGEGYEGLGFSWLRVDGAHPLSVMVVAVSPRVRMVLRVGRCTELIGSRFLRMMASVFTLPHGGVLGLRGRQLYCEQGKGCGEAEVVEEACCIAYPVCNATAPPGQHENSTEVDTAGAQRQGQPHTSTHITSWSAAGPQHGHSEAPTAHPGGYPVPSRGF